MYRADIERLAAQSRRVERLTQDLLEAAETLDENSVDTTTATALGADQAELQDEIEQALLDFETIIERSDGVGQGPDYVPGSGSFTFSWDEANEELTITYGGGVDISNSDITVAVAGTVDNSAFSSPTTTGDTHVVDTSSLVDQDLVEVEWVATDSGSNKIALPNSSRSPVDKTNLPSESSLTKTSTTYNTSFVITR